MHQKKHAKMALKLQARYPRQLGMVYGFYHNLSEDTQLQLRTDKFGGYAWKITLNELAQRGFNWQDFLVE